MSKKPPHATVPLKCIKTFRAFFLMGGHLFHMSSVINVVLLKLVAARKSTGNIPINHCYFKEQQMGFVQLFVV
jgi:hypothetical protein